MSGREAGSHQVTAPAGGRRNDTGRTLEKGPHMSTSVTSEKRGGSWLLGRSDPSPVFSPERMTDEHRMIAQTTREFVEKEVLPNLERLEAKDWALNRQLIRRAAELGLVGADVPEAYGGVGLDKAAAVIVSDRMAESASFTATFGAQANLTVLPLLLFGTEEQRSRYLPGLLAGDTIGAYCLSESGSGSDALGARARARRLDDGSFALDGEKMWITNGGFADIYIVFAKVDGEHFTAFLVERAFPGVSSGKEEHKLGLHGSSTTPVLLQDARVPAANLLGEIGKGHKVAFNVLNFGRFKLGAMCVGAARGAIGEAARYAAERRQFGQPIAAFGAIKHKLGEMTARTYAVESLVYRTVGLIDEALADHAGFDPAAVLTAVEEYAVESSIAKVVGSEVLDFVLDENVQVHGGNGFVRDYPAERHYRDARVNRIFEGTNEINRLLIPGMLVRRALKGGLPIIPAAKKLQEELLSPSVPQPGTAPGGDPLAAELRGVDGMRKVALMVLGLAMQRYGEKLSDEQEVLMSAADILIDLYAAESATLRAADALQRPRADAAGRAGEASVELHLDAARVFVNDAIGRVELNARQALAAMADGDTLRVQLAALKRLLKAMPINTVGPRRRLADATVRKRGYLFS